MVVNVPVVDRPGIYKHLSVLVCASLEDWNRTVGYAHSLRNTNAEEIKVSDTRELEEELLRKEIPRRITCCSNIVRDVWVSALGIYQRMIMLYSQRYATSVLGYFDILPTEK